MGKTVNAKGLCVYSGSWWKVFVTSLLTIVLVVVQGLTFRSVTRGEDAEATNLSEDAPAPTRVDGTNARTKTTMDREMRFDLTYPRAAVAPALPERLNFRISDKATLAVEYKRLEGEDFLSTDVIDQKDKAVIVSLGGGQSGKNLFNKEGDTQRYNISFFYRLTGLGSSSRQYLSGEQKFMGIPEQSTAAGLAALYHLTDQLAFDTTFETSDMDGDRWIGGLHYLLPNDHVLSLQGRYVTSRDSDLDGTPTVMFMYVIPLGVRQGR